MAKVFSVHQDITLHEGASAEEFERFVTEEAYPAFSTLQGWTPYLLRGIKGNRSGQYLWLVEIESIEAFTRFVLLEGTHTEEAEQFLASNAAVFERWQTFASGPFVPIFTDYLAVGREDEDAKAI